MNTEPKNIEQHLHTHLSPIVIGMQSVIRALAIAVIGRGHVLLQGPPGLGKTLLSISLAQTLGGSFKRIQGTADLMPADILGVSVYDATKAEFVFRPGPIFADVVLVDEVNRTGPKTQSALLEAMEERRVSVERKWYALPADFLVIATQNPRDFEGTYPLPESQLDRFMLRIDMPYPARDHELQVLQQYGVIEQKTAHAIVALPRESLVAARTAVDAIHVAPELLNYVTDLARASREHAHIALGLSTRGALALLKAARIHAALQEREFVSPDDVKAVAIMVMSHRMLLSTEAQLEGLSEHGVVQQMLEQVPVPR